MAEFSKGEPAPVTTGETFPRNTWRAPGVHKRPYAVALDRKAQLQLNTSHVNGDAFQQQVESRRAQESAHDAEGEQQFGSDGLMETH